MSAPAKFRAHSTPDVEADLPRTAAPPAVHALAGRHGHGARAAGRHAGRAGREQRQEVGRGVQPGRRAVHREDRELGGGAGLLGRARGEGRRTLQCGRDHHEPDREPGGPLQVRQPRVRHADRLRAGGDGQDTREEGAPLHGHGEARIAEAHSQLHPRGLRVPGPAARAGQGQDRWRAAALQLRVRRDAARRQAPVTLLTSASRSPAGTARRAAPRPGSTG